MKPNALKSFLSYNHWIAGKDLLDFQIQHKTKNKHYNKINFFYYEKVKEETPILSKEEYFNDKISNNFFYALTNEFFVENYLVPKKGLGLRPYSFLSYPITVLQYSITSYLVEITQRYLIESTESNTKSYYGGKLYYQDNKLVIKEYNTNYYYSYKEYKQHLNSWTILKKDRLSIKIDIQSFYDSINIRVLLDHLYKCISHSTKSKYNFNQDTINQIEFFFHFLNRGSIGIPQSDNNIASSFIGHLYLHIGDNIISDAIKEINLNHKNAVINHQIIRYVDDTYIYLDVKEDTTTKEKDILIYKILTSISEAFYSKLRLQINNKTKIYDLGNSSDFLDISREIGNTSEDIPEPKESNKSEKGKLDDFFKNLSLLNKTRINHNILHSNKRLDFIKNIFDSNVDNLLNKQENANRLKFLMNDFDYDLCRLMPQAIICICFKVPEIKEKLREYIKSLNPNSYYDLQLIIIYLCQTNFTDNEIIKILSKNKTSKKILKHFKKPIIKDESSGYCRLPYNSILIIREQLPLLEQIRLRIHNENISSYSVSLNLLLNEIQYICCLLENKNIHSYECKSAIKFLEEKGVDSDTKTSISNLFDRRNHVPITHAGDNSRVSTAVSKKEYTLYKGSFKKAIQRLLISSN